MDARQLTALLKNPGLLHSIQEDELSDAASRYPYSSLLQTLLVKKYQILGETDLDSNLARAALLHPDREQLSHFIDRAIPDISAINYTEPVVAKPQPELVIEKPKTVAQGLPEPEQAPKPQPREVEAEMPSVSLEFFPPNVEPIVLEELLKPVEEELKETEPEKPVPTESPKEEKPIVATGNKASFNQWLQRVNVGEVSDSQALDKQIQAVGYEAMLMKSAEKVEPEPEKEKPAKVEKPTKAKAEPKEDRPATEEGWGEKVTQMAQKSVAFDDDLVTETLAKIFELQKKYSKALDAYEKLAIRFPDKKAQYKVAIDRLKARLS